MVMKKWWLWLTQQPVLRETVYVRYNEGKWGSAGPLGRYLRRGVRLVETPAEAETERKSPGVIRRWEPIRQRSQEVAATAA